VTAVDRLREDVQATKRANEHAVIELRSAYVDDVERVLAEHDAMRETLEEIAESTSEPWFALATRCQGRARAVLARVKETR